VRQQQAKYYNGEVYDAPVAGIIALVLGGIIGAVAYAFLGAFGFFSFIGALFLGPVIGGLIAEAIRVAVRKRRAQGMKWAAVIGCLAGILLGGLVLYNLPLLAAGAPVFTILASLPRLLLRIDVIIFGVLAASTIYARLL
jgi:hypothetical protein